MPLKTVKKDTADALTLEWILHVKHYKLALDKNTLRGLPNLQFSLPERRD